MTGAVAAINCTNCGAGLDVLGGGRVKTQICGYCGAALDTNDDFKVLQVYGDMARPATPFKLGMTGEIEGVPFTIIGILGQVERYEGQEWRWVDHMLYSPTHGYCWLTLEDGHTILTRKTRDWPPGPFVTAREVERAEHRPSRTWHGEKLDYYATSNWQTDFAEGEFNWNTKVGERGSTVSMMAKGAAAYKLLYVETPGSEREIEVSRYFPEAAEVFGVDTAPVPKGVHALQPYEASGGKGFYLKWFGALTAACLALMVFLMAGGAPDRNLYVGPAGEIPPELTFEVSDLTRPVRLNMRHNLSQAWAEWEVQLTDPGGQALAYTNRGISFYSGGSGEDSWTEGSRYGELTFEPTQAGTYTLKMTMVASARPAQATQTFFLSVREGQTNALWIGVVAGVMLLAFLWTASSRMRHRAKRWSGSDWTEEDDD